MGSLLACTWGLPLGAPHKYQGVWDPIEVRFEKRLGSWKIQYISKLASWDIDLASKHPFQFTYLFFIPFLDAQVSLFKIRGDSMRVFVGWG